MATRTVVSRTRRAEPAASELPFTREMFSALSGNGSLAAGLRDYRNQAWEAYSSLGMPTSKDEPWRRTDLRGMPAESFRLPDAQSRALLEAPPEDLLAPIVGDAQGGRVALTAQGASSWLAPELAAQGVVFTDLLTAERQHPELLARMLGQTVLTGEGKFAALAGAGAWTGVVVYVPRNVIVEQPLQSLLWGPGAGLAYLSHILVLLEDGASLTYVHEAASHTEAQGQSLHAGIVEIQVGQGANLRFVELQSWGEHVWNFSHERARVARDGQLDWIFGAIGSHLTKNFSELELVGEGANGRMSGFYFTDGVQHLDHDTQQNHLAPHTTSDLLFKGALKDKSRSVWQGMIYVARDAQKTDGYQANRNLTLSPNARADSIPGLEILADDVRCTHGATVGKIDPELVFYLRSRGLPYADAERLVVEGFFDPIMQRIPFDGVRERFQKAILEKMGVKAL
jgi:Fe-S cluster assembly protein SufD